MGSSSDKDAVHASFWNWKAMSVVCLHFPRHFCNCHSRNAVWFLLPCQAAMYYWLHVRNHSAHLLGKTIRTHIPEYIFCVVFERMKHIYLCSDLIVVIRYSDECWYPVLKSVFELYLCHQRHNSDPMIRFVSYQSWKRCYVSPLLDLILFHLHYKEAPFY